MKNFFYFIVLTYTSLFATMEDKEKEYEQKLRNNIESNMTRTSEGYNIRNTEQQKIYTDNDLKIAKFLYSEISSNDTIPNKNISTKVINDYAYNFNAEIEKENKKNNSESNSSNENKKEIFTIRTTGYCSFPNDIEIGKLAGYAYINCDLKKLGKVELAVLLTPDIYAEALIGQPLYISNSDYRSLNLSGVLLNSSKTSLNIANVINDFKIEKILASGAYKGSTIASKYAQEYVENKKNQARKEESETYNNAYGSNTVQTVNYESLPLKTLFIAAGVELVSAFAKEIANANQNNISYLFKINRGNVVFVDMTLTNKEEAYTTIKHNEGKSLIINQNPFFNINEKENNTFENKPGNLTIKNNTKE